jgi:hypothetical protein
VKRRARGTPKRKPTKPLRPAPVRVLREWTESGVLNRVTDCGFAEVMRSEGLAPGATAAQARAFHDSMTSLETQQAPRRFEEELEGLVAIAREWLEAWGVVEIASEDDERRAREYEPRFGHLPMVGSWRGTDGRIRWANPPPEGHTAADDAKDFLEMAERAVNSIRRVRAGGDELGRALRCTLECGRIFERMQLARRFEAWVIPKLEGFERSAATKKLRAADKARRELAAAAEAWSRNPELTKVQVAAEVARKVKGARHSKRIAASLPRRDELLARFFPCASRAGVRRPAHAPDKDGICVHCGIAVNPVKPRKAPRSRA